MDYSNIYSSIKLNIIEILKDLYQINNDNLLEKITAEPPKIKSHGDISTNAALILSKQLKMQPKKIAEEIIEKISIIKDIKTVEIAGPGFINITFNIEFWTNILKTALENHDFGRTDIGLGDSVNIEFVSANPTGPLHIGHARGAIYGDVLSRIMEFCGFKIYREYYLNDAGSQISTLIESAHLRYKQLFGHKSEIPEGLYPGSYLIGAAENIKSNYGDIFLELTEKNYYEFKDIVLSEMLKIIKYDLAKMKIKHDIFFSEQNLHNKLNNNTESIIDKTINELKDGGIIYKGKLPKPKAEEPESYKNSEDNNREQLLFKATKFGDDQDRSLTKEDGSYTYFAADIAYAKNKIDRNFKKNYIVLGADHIGYVKRLQAAYNALSSGKAEAKVLLCQLVNFIKDGQSVKMSKRAGSFTTALDVINEVGADVLRFIMLTRKNDVILDFDLDLVKSQTKDNPVFYVQYSQVRCLSVLKNAKENFPEIYNGFSNKEYDLKKITSTSEIELIKTISLFPKIISSAALYAEPHKLTYYLIELASNFHSLWNQGKDDEYYKFLLSSNPELSKARLALISATAKIIRKGLNLIGVEPLDKM